MQITDAIKNNPLFNGIAPDDLERLLDCLAARTEEFDRGETVMFTGDAVKTAGLVLSGSLKVTREDADGDAVILTELGVAEVFGEVFAFAGVPNSPVTVTASGRSRVMFIDCGKIVADCRSSCSFHTKLTKNMLSLIAQKALMLNQKIEIISRRTVRKKILSFFDIHRNGARSFTIPYNREEMARYICADRSALSNELCKMRDEGLIKFYKNRFELLSREAARRDAERIVRRS